MANLLDTVLNCNPKPTYLSQSANTAIKLESWGVSLEKTTRT